MSQTCQCRNPTHAQQQQASLFDNVVSAREQRRGNVEAKQTCRFQIDNEFELGRLQNWKLGGLGTFEDGARINAHLAKHVGKVGSVTNQQAGCGHLARKSASGKSVTRSERGKLRAPARKKSVRGDEKGVRSRTGNGRKRRIDLSRRTGAKKSSSRPRPGVTSLRAFEVASVVAALAGLTSTAKRAAFGSNSCISPSRLPSISLAKKLIPLALVCGRGRLFTQPSATRSSPNPDTIGIVSVAAFAA